MSRLPFESDADTLVADLAYDGLGRRITKRRVGRGVPRQPRLGVKYRVPGTA